MAGKDLRAAAEKIAERKKLMRMPVPMVPDAPDNIGISKAEFIARRRKNKEIEVEKEKVWQEHVAKKGKESDVVQGEETKAKKVGRPKRVE